MGAVEGRDRRGLRQPVALEHDAAERCLEAVQDLERERGSARHADAQRGGVAAIAAGLVEQRGVHRRHALEDRHAGALHQLEHVRREEAGQQREARARRDGEVEPDRLAERVEQRQRAEHDVVALDRQQVEHHLDVRREVAVGELRALRPAGRARRVQDDGGVVGRAGSELVVRLGVAGQRFCVVEHQRGARVFDVVVDLARLEQRVHRHDDPADPQDPVVRHRELRDVGEHHADAVARLHPARAEHAGNLGAGGVELGVGEPGVAERERGAITVAACGRGQVRGQVRHGRGRYARGSSRSMARAAKELRWCVGGGRQGCRWVAA